MYEPPFMFVQLQLSILSSPVEPIYLCFRSNKSIPDPENYWKNISGDLKCVLDKDAASLILFQNHCSQLLIIKNIMNKHNCENFNINILFSITLT